MLYANNEIGKCIDSGGVLSVKIKQTVLFIYLLVTSLPARDFVALLFFFFSTLVSKVKNFTAGLNLQKQVTGSSGVRKGHEDCHRSNHWL